MLVVLKSAKFNEPKFKTTLQNKRHSATQKTEIEILLRDC